MHKPCERHNKQKKIKKLLTGLNQTCYGAVDLGLAELDIVNPNIGASSTFQTYIDVIFE